MSERDRPASGPLADDAGGLRFDTFEDAARFTRQGVERSNRFMAAQGSTPAKFYEDGHFNIKVELCAGSRDRNCHFLLSAVPPVDSPPSARDFRFNLNDLSN